jgi:hypothetical protein
MLGGPTSGFPNDVGKFTAKFRAGILGAANREMNMVVNQAASGFLSGFARKLWLKL